MITGLQIVNEINRKLGWPKLTTLENPSPSDEQIKVLEVLNRTLESFGAYNDWPILRKEGTLVTLADEVSTVDDNTLVYQYVTATQDSTTVTVDQMTFDDSYVGRAFQVSGDNYVYRIDAVIGPTQITLNRAWVSASITAADERTFRIAMDRYALPEDLDRPVDDWEAFFAPYKIIAITPEQMREKRRSQPGIVVGEPKYFTVWGTNDNETAELLHLFPYPTEKRMLIYDYIKIHPQINSDNDKVLYSRKHLGFLVDAVYQICTRDFENDDKEQALLFQMMNDYNKQLSNPGVAGTALRIVPRNSMRTSFYRAQALAGYRVDWGHNFDIAGFFDLP